MKKAFTLIELLIVVAIIAILAAIAVPNFLESQTRAKVSRVKADQRTLATALESYFVDNNEYPTYNNPRDFALPAALEFVSFTPPLLTTPLSYLSTLPPDAFPPDPLVGLADPTRPTEYFYKNNYYIVYLGKTQPDGHVQDHYRSLTGQEESSVQWEVWSYGPDLDDDHGVVLYDPTNGTRSNGDQMRFGP